MRSYVHAASLVLAAGLVATLVSWLVGEVSAPRVSSDPDTVAADPEGERRQGGLVGGPEPGIESGRRVEAPAPREDQLVAARGSLLFVIRDSLDSPVPGVWVSLDWGSRQRSTVTGSGGEAAFEDLAAGRYAYRVEAPAHPLLTAAAPLQLQAGELRRLELRLGEFDRVVAGRVVDQDDASVAGLAVRARLYRPPADPSTLVPQSQADQRAETAADGSFEIGGLREGEYEVRTIATERYPSAKAIVRAGTDSVLLTLVERRELAVFGQVTSADGEPLTGVRVVHLGQPSRRTRTDGEGWYELLVAVREGQVPRLRFDLEGYQAERVDLNDAALGANDARLDAMLMPVSDTVEVSAHLLDEQGAPVAGERVYLHSPGLRTHYQAVSGAAGTARFPEVAASADYRARVAPRGPYKDYARSVDLSGGAALEIVLEPLAVGALSGHMIDPAGEPVPQFSLRLYSADARAKRRQVSGDADGYFEIAEVPAGPLTLQAVSTPQLQITGVEVDDGANTYVELVLDWGDAMLEGWVIDANDDPVAGADVDLYWTRNEGPVHSRSARRTFTDGRGAFLFSRLGRATHRLEVTAPGHVRHQQTVQTDTPWVEVRLEPGGP